MSVAPNDTDFDSGEVGLSLETLSVQVPDCKSFVHSLVFSTCTHSSAFARDCDGGIFKTPGRSCRHNCSRADKQRGNQRPKKPHFDSGGVDVELLGATVNYVPRKLSSWNAENQPAWVGSRAVIM